MIILELGLLIIGAVFVIASFFLSEKLSSKELTEMAKLSEQELKTLMDLELEKAESRVEDAIDTAIDESTVKVERALDKETNEKIMAINEYSDTVMQDLNKTHEEVLFLYSMLNDRHDELTRTAGDIRTLIKENEEAKEGKEAKELIPKKEEPASEPQPEVKEEPAAETPKEAPSEAEPVQDHRAGKILGFFAEGKTEVEIAQLLHMGVGEVRLIRNLSRPKTEEADEAEVLS